MNGRAFDADDVLYSWKRFTTVGNQRTAYSNALNPDAPITSVTAPDAKTIVVKLKSPNFAILAMFGARENVNLVPKEAEDTSVLDLRKTMIGTGPYYVSDYTTSIGWTLKKFDKFWDTNRPYFDQINNPIITEYSALLSQFKAGNVHVLNNTEIQQPDVLQTKKTSPRSTCLTAASTRPIIGASLAGRPKRYATIACARPSPWLTTATSGSTPCTTPRRSRTPACPSSGAGTRL